MIYTPLSQWDLFKNGPLFIAGPCSAESREQILQAAENLAKIECISVFRAGVWKPRTRPLHFEGHGKVALPWLNEVKQRTRLLTATEVANKEHVEEAIAAGVDILWIGARTTVSPFSIQEIADAIKGHNIPVFIKNPVTPDLDLWIGALERISAVGIRKIGAIHRGFTTNIPGRYRNLPMWSIPVELKRRFPDLPLLVDPSHIAGERELVGEVLQMAFDFGANGAIVESHPNPDQALSDAKQQVTPAALEQILNDLIVRKENSDEKEYSMKLKEYRAQIDRFDRECLETLKFRFSVVENIARLKEAMNITPLQIGRMDDLLKERIQIGQELGLSENFVSELFHSIHTESVKIQTALINPAKRDK